jgi:hypothetical protein
MSLKYIAKKSDGLPAFPMDSVGGMLMTWKYDECVEVIETVKAKCTNNAILCGYCGICNKKVFNTQARICINGVYSHDDNRYCKYLKWGVIKLC